MAAMLRYEIICCAGASNPDLFSWLFFELISRYFYRAEITPSEPDPGHAGAGK